MRTFRIARRAYLDIDEIADFIKQDNPVRAETFVEEIAAKIEQIADRPLSFPERGEWRQGLRSALHGRYLILFRCDDDIVDIVRVLHGARNIARIIIEADED